MMPDRQDDTAYNYVRSIIETVRLDGIPVVFGLRRVPGAVDGFTAYLEYLDAGPGNPMPHTGELKRAVREAFGQCHDAYVGDGTVPVLGSSLTDAQRDVIRRGIDKLRGNVPSSSSDYWNGILSRWYNLFSRSNNRDGSGKNGNVDIPEEDLFEDDGCSYVWDQELWQDYARDSDTPLSAFAEWVKGKARAVGECCIWVVIAVAIGYLANRCNLIGNIREVLNGAKRSDKVDVGMDVPSASVAEYAYRVSCINCGSVLEISHVVERRIEIVCPACGCNLYIERVN